MDTYTVKFRKNLPMWRTITVRGHNMDKTLDRMDLYLPDGSIFSIAQWSKYDMRLGLDWVLFTKRQMERDAGQPVVLNV